MIHNLYLEKTVSYLFQNIIILIFKLLEKKTVCNIVQLAYYEAEMTVKSYCELQRL